MEAPPPSVNVLPAVELACAACTTGLHLAGSQILRDETGPQNGLATLLPDHDRLDVYLCPRCHRVEFFAATVGEVPRAEVTRNLRGAEGTVETLLREANQLELQEQAASAVARYELIKSRFPGTTYARDADERVRKIRTKMEI